MDSVEEDGGRCLSLSPKLSVGASEIKLFRIVKLIHSSIPSTSYISAKKSNFFRNLREFQFYWDRRSIYKLDTNQISVE